MSLKMFLLLDPKMSEMLPIGIDLEDNNYFVRLDPFGNPLELCYDLYSEDLNDDEINSEFLS